MDQSFAAAGRTYRQAVERHSALGQLFYLGDGGLLTLYEKVMAFTVQLDLPVFDLPENN
jgi:hypothetical protein